MRTNQAHIGYTATIYGLYKIVGEGVLCWGHSQSMTFGALGLKGSLV